MKRKFEPYEGSEEERFRKALAKCRNCSHLRLAHGLLKNNKCSDAKLSVDGTYTSCSCSTYESVDNLEFLESKYEAKKKRS
jgi:hypothetical protein